MADTAKLEEVVSFWDSIDKRKKFMKDEAFDALLVEKYSSLHADINSGVYDSMIENPTWILAQIIVLDQFSRNMFRGTPQAFASDPKALSLTIYAISKGFDKAVGENTAWFYMPLMHSEDLCHQDDCVKYFQENTDWDVSFASKHRDIIAKYGRFPHRNATLNRDTTVEEAEFLTQEGSGF